VAVVTTETPGYGTGLLPSWDTKNENYPVAALLDPSAALVSKNWPLAQRVNQGNEPKCVGASLAQELSSEPVVIPISHPYTMDNIYNLAQKLDEWAGEGYAGTSLLAGLKALKQYGYLGEYRWAASVEDVLQSLSQLGPVIMAGPWLSGMFTPDAQGYVNVTGTGGNTGHAYMLGAVDAPTGDTTLKQTWGPNWSVMGWDAKLRADSIRQLLSMGTQAAIITQRLNPSIPTPPAPVTKGNIVLTEATGTQRRFAEA
jgi:hypothetical protein